MKEEQLDVVDAEVAGEVEVVNPDRVTADDPEGDGLTTGQTTADVHGDILGI